MAPSIHNLTTNLRDGVYYTHGGKFNVFRGEVAGQLDEDAERPFAEDLRLEVLGDDDEECGEPYELPEPHSVAGVGMADILREFGLEGVNLAWEEEAQKHRKPGATTDIPPDYERRWRESGNMEIWVKPVYTIKRDAQGKRKLRCRWALLWHIVKRDSSEGTYVGRRPTGSTPSTEQIRMISIAAAVDGDLLECSDEPSAFLHSPFRWRNESIGDERIQLSDSLPYPIIRIPRYNAPPLRQMMKNGVNGARGNPQSHEEDRDERFETIGFYRSNFEESLKLGSYLCPAPGGPRLYNEIPEGGFPVFPFSRRR